MPRQSKAAREAEALAVAAAIAEAPEGTIEELETVAAVAPVETVKPSRQFITGDYRFDYFELDNGQYVPRLYVKNVLFFSGWACVDYNAAKSLLIPIYYQLSGELKAGTQKRMPIDLLATHPLNRLIYPENNVNHIRESLTSEGNLTDLFPIVANPLGLVLSGNSRLLALELLQLETGEAQAVGAGISDGLNDLNLILSGNHQRTKTTTEIINEAMAEAAKKGGKQYLTNVRNAYIALGGVGGGGGFDAGWAVKKFLQGGTASPEFNKAASIINETSPTVAYELTKIQKAEDEGMDSLAAELNKMARAKSAQPLNPDKVYQGLAADVAKIRQHYTGETAPAIARELTLATPEIRQKLVEAKVNGDKQKLSILRDQLENEPATADPNAVPDWNAINDAEEEATAPATSATTSAPASTSNAATAAAPTATAATAPAPVALSANAAHFQDMRAKNRHEADCWLTNEATAAAFNEAIGGVADVDPYAEVGQHIKADRLILATEDPESLEDWGGGIHAKATGLTVATALPLKNGGIAAFAEIMRRIELAEVSKAVFSCDAALLHLPRIAAYFKALPLGYVLVSRESEKEATAGFGFEPSPFVHSNVRYKTITADNWNDRALSYAIVYYGDDYSTFEAACGKYGVVGYTPKAALARSIAFDWFTDSNGNLSANHLGSQYATDAIGENVFLIIDGVRRPEKYKRPEDAKRAALLHSLTGE